MRRLIVLLALLWSMTAIGQTHKAASQDQANTFTDINQFVLGVRVGPKPFSALPSESDGGVIYCSDCQPTTPCTAGGPGAIALGFNGAWACAAAGGGANPAGTDGNIQTKNGTSLGAIANVAAGSQVVSNPAGTGFITQTKPKYDLRDFGAVGNGTADDTTAIQNWLNSGGAGNTAGLYCKAGTYKYTSQITYTGASSQGLTIEGEAVGRGIHGCVFKYAGSAGLAGGFYFNGLNQSVISNVYFDGNQLLKYVVWFNGTNDTGGPISSGVQLKNVTCGNPQGSAGSGLTGSGCLVFSHGTGGPEVSEVTLDNVLVQGAQLAGSTGLLVLNGGNTKNFLIRGNSSFNGFDYGMFFGANGTVEVDGNNFGNNTQADIYSEAATNYIANNKEEGSARFYIGNGTQGLHTLINNSAVSAIVPQDNPPGFTGGYMVIAAGNAVTLINNYFVDNRTGSTVALVSTGAIGNAGTSVYSNGNQYVNATVQAPIFDAGPNLLTTDDQTQYGATRSFAVTSVNDIGGAQGGPYINLKNYQQGGGSARFDNVRSTTTNTAYPSGGCFLCLAKTDHLDFRNNANGANRKALSLTGTDQVQVGDATSGVYIPGGAVLGSATSGSEGAGTLNAQGLYVNGVSVSGSTPFPTPGTAISLSGPRGYALCTGTCNITLPTPAAGYEFCAVNDDGIATVITLVGIANVQWESTDRTTYGVAGQTFTSSGAIGDKICVVGRDATHYLTLSYQGIWTLTPYSPFTQIASDNFTRANENPLSDGGNWTTQNSFQPMTLQTDVVQATAAGDNGSLWTGGTIGADQYSTATISSFTNGAYFSCLLRGSTSTNTFYLVSAHQGGTTVTIRAVVAGAVHDIATPTISAVTAGQTISCGIFGYTLYFYVNGTEITSATDGTHYIATGHPGIGEYPISNPTEVKYSSWSGGNFAH